MMVQQRPGCGRPRRSIQEVGDVGEKEDNGIAG